MLVWVFVLLLTAQKLSLSSSHYHVLVADDRTPLTDKSLNTLSSHLRHRRSLVQPDDILSSMIEYEGSGTDGPEDEQSGEIQEFQFFMKNNDQVNSARTTISELMPGNAILMDFSIHNEGKTYRYDKQRTKGVEEASLDFQNSVSSGLSTVMLGDVKTSPYRCSDCRADESDGLEAVAAIINVAPGDILSISLSYMVPQVVKIMDSEKIIYRTDVTIDLEPSATNFTGVLMSPNYPQDYPNSADLTWLINAPTIDMVISSKLISFSSEDCCDHLYIYDGPTDTYPLIYVISGEVSSQKTIVTTRSSMLVKFQTDSLLTAGGFSLEFHPTTRDILQEDQIDEDKLGQINDTLVMFDSFGIIKTPDYPEFYPASSTLNWDIMVESRYTIDLQIIDFDVFPGETLEVIDMNTNEVYFTLDSDASIPYNFNVSTNELSLLFHSAAKVIPKRGLYCKYFSRQAEEINLLSSDTEWHTISSPHYPYHYSSNQYLVWIVTVDDPSSWVRIEVVSLYLERGYDFLAVYSGSSIDNSKRLATLSGDDGKGVEYMTRENSATIVFQSDRSITDTGFQLRFRNYMVYTNCSAVTDVIQGGPSGSVRNLNYPNYDYYSHDCQWLIQVKESKIISIFIEKFLGSYATVTFYDGDSKTDPIIWTSNGDSSIYFDDAVSQRSSSNQMLAIISRTSSYNTAFSFRYQAVDIENYPTCDPDVVYTVAPGQITSPKYPLNAPYADCSWIIQAPSEYQVLVTVKYLYVYSHSATPINFYEGNSTTDPFIVNCNYCDPGDWIRSGTNVMLIDASISSAARFKFEYEFVSGSTSLSNRQVGSATSPSFPGAYPDTSYEVTHIDVSSGNIMLYFETFETEECCDVLNIYDGDSTSSPTIASLKGNHQGFQAQTSGRYLTLEFSSDGSVTGPGFKMDYCSTTEDCTFSDVLTSAYSYHQLTNTDYYYYLASPSASGYYPVMTDFYWYLECPLSTYRIRYDFERLDLDHTDSLTLYNDFTMNENYVALRYSSGVYDYYDGYSVYGVAPQNVLWFHSDPAFTGMGFYVRYFCDT